jgi:methylglyoxal synthase/pSer/pThr/pTyr-binding forkhead associated (FHA) protein
MKIKVYYVELDPKLEDREFDLGSIFKLNNECTIGRSPESDLVLDSPDLSRSHGRIISKNGNYYFIDLGSRNGSLFNDLLTTPSQEYLLNHDDTIRIGDFVLKIEEEEEQAATVFKVIDPALFKRKQTPVEDIPRPEVVVPPILPVVELAQNAALTPPPIHDDEVPVVPVVEPYSPTALVVDEFDDRSTFVQLGENHPPAALIVDESDDNDDEVPVVPVVEPHSPTALVVDEFDDRSTFVQLGENRPPAALIVDELDNDDEVPVVPVVEPHPPAALANDELDDELPVVPIVQSIPPTALVVDEFDDLSTLVQLGENHPSAALANDELEEEEEEVPVAPVVEPYPPTALVIDELEEEKEEVPVAPVVEPYPPTALVIDELEEANLEFEASSSLPIVAIAAENAIELNTPNKRFGAELLKQKQIVLIAHDEKIVDLVELIDRNKDFLGTCLTISWASISDSLRQETGMVVSKEIANGAAGGYQALAGLVNSGDVLAVIFLRDLFAQNQAGKANEEAMLRLCNINEILLGTNIATADAIVHYLQS